MGIESDQLVFDYLSRIGDLAHSTRMTAAERAKLVGGLRGEIDKARAAEGGAESKGAVKKILGRLGRPEDVVAAANGGVGPALSSPVPSQRGAFEQGSQGARGPQAPSPAPSPSDFSPTGPPSDEPGLPPQRTGPSAAFGASSPHLASMDELGPEESDPDWWRVDPSPYGNGEGGSGAVAAGEPVPGFVGGIELPEILKPPPGAWEEETKGAKGPDLTKDAGQPAAQPEPATEAAPPASPARRGASLLRRGLGRRGDGSDAGPRRGGFVELTAAALLVAGAVTGSLVPLGLGWLAAWWSPKLSRIEAKWAAFGMPGLVLAATVVWFWGRTEGHWGGAPIAAGGDALREAMGDTWPVLLRCAAGASALYLVWRARRPASG